MLNPFHEVNWSPNLAERKKFALSLIIGFPVVALIGGTVARLTTHIWKPFFLWLGVIGLGVGIVLWLLPQIAKSFYVLSYFVGCCMGIVVGNVVFAAFYYLVLTPMGIAMRLAGHDPLPGKIDRSASTYWQEAEKNIDLKRYYRQF